MLRSAIARSGARAGRGFAPRTQWQFRRTFADAPPDRTVLPGSQSASAAGVPQAPVLGGNPPPPQQAAASQVPKEPPPPPPSSTPPKPRRRFRKFLLTMFLLTTLGYGGGVWYSLQSDNFHDFFTEFVPYGEDVVAYFEEREFRKRFPVKEYNDNKWQQIRGENKVTIGRQSGVEPKAAEKSSSSLSSANKVQEGAKPQPEKAQQTPGAASEREKTQAVESAKKSEDVSSAAKAAPAVDHVNIAQATEPVVQNLVNMVNGVIAAVNASPEDASKYSSTIQTMKNNVEKVISGISTMKDSAAQEAEQALKNAHTEFDSAAKELVRRLEQELRAQEGKWREEYESERERLSSTYQDRLRAELEAAEKVSEEKNKNALLEQEIALQKAYMQTVADKVEAERNGRLAKIDALSESVGELDKLTGEWNQVLDATLRTQHLQIAVEAVRAKVLESEYPTPFLNELVALKEVSGEDEVVNAAIASINPLAYQRGIPSPASLIERFRRVASEVRKASLLPEDAGVASHAASAVLSRMMFAKKSDRGLPEGDDVEATLARTEVLLEEGDLDAAAREMNGLKGWAGVLSRDWVGECRRVLEVRQAVEVIATEARLQSLLVE
ncbi:hypothetical protein KC340_g7162 [Hortaea werneckii]|nr:hypothetical protein KC342_g7579 [Hortaea werneckii]KAI7097644.1 hypothetical protein KC339_g9545 [Hortaea werneckii]KAI7322058.1 hypothetical protein KC340_g7162 [Hortaea werneckii]KAI7374188.1 hypothetical protein KC328_g16158 [Hortaea werneckii]